MACCRFVRSGRWQADYKTQKSEKRERREERKERAKQASLAPRTLYLNLRGRFGLETLDPAWLQLEQPDRNGFRGLTCSATVKAEDGAEVFHRDGYRAKRPLCAHFVPIFGT